MPTPTPAIAPQHGASPAEPVAATGHVCPWWLGPLLASPIRRLIESPERLLRPFAQPGMTVVEPGCGMGFFSLPLARLVGPTGRVICVDLQLRMIEGLRRRARRAGLDDRIQASVCSADDLGLAGIGGTADLAVLIHMLHEVGDKSRFLSGLHVALRPGGTVVVVEPKGHVSPADFAASLDLARSEGFRVSDRAIGRRRRSAVLEKARSTPEAGAL
jgi:ubiquinone/menaquinone biosynthesis C-methylase UbiE